MSDWQIEHGRVIRECVNYINSASKGFILKGGTALALCYCLDRFSEDIDLDGTDKCLKDIVEAYCHEYGYTYRVAKDTAYVQRCFINYGNISKPLKVEASYRQLKINEDRLTIIGGILVYNIDTLFMMKINAFIARDRIRDLYDVAFIYKEYAGLLTLPRLESLQDSLKFKGLDYFDYIVRTQADELIPVDKLVDNYLSMYDGLGLLSDKSVCHEGEEDDEDWNR